MRRILLTSSGLFMISNNIDPLLPKKISDCRIAYITTAAKEVDDISYVTRQKKEMDAKGLNYTEMDIESRSKREIEVMLSGYDVVMIEGGNTFYLLRAVRESRFDKVIKKMIHNGVVYIGSSAGSYIACPSIIMATWSGRGFDRCGITHYEAMDLVPIYIKAHYSPDMKALLDDKVASLDGPLYALTDRQAIWVCDDQIELLGEGEEMVWNSLIDNEIERTKEDESE